MNSPEQIADHLRTCWPDTSPWTAFWSCSPSTRHRRTPRRNDHRPAAREYIDDVDTDHTDNRAYAATTRGARACAESVGIGAVVSCSTEAAHVLSGSGCGRSALHTALSQLPYTLVMS
ncbi:hypothetical protein ACFWWC_48865 [Streptomyces sp. NPDC058642]|uniref:hypothetical protein n=1 Tax=Streptomyces sp. NPDC058642 TaxID=3346572 RepID=UPI00364AE9BD